MTRSCACLRATSRSAPTPRAFLTTVAQRVLSNHWRREQIERAYLDALALRPEAHAPSPEERAVVLETLLEIDRLLDGLPLAAKRAFLLAQLDGSRRPRSRANSACRWRR